MIQHWARYTTKFVENSFRPLLDKIDFPNLDMSSVEVIPYVDLGKYLPVLDGEKIRLAIIARDTLNAGKEAAYTILNYEKNENDKDIYTICICMSKDLFNGGPYDNPMIRNIIGIHEL